MLKCIRLTEEHTNSSKRVFLKFLLQELDQSLGRQKLSARFKVIIWFPLLVSFL